MNSVSATVMDMVKERVDSAETVVGLSTNTFTNTWLIRELAGAEQKHKDHTGYGYDEDRNYKYYSNYYTNSYGDGFGNGNGNVVGDGTSVFANDDIYHP